MLARAEMLAIALNECRDALRREPRDGMPQSIVQPEADDVARLLARWHLQAEVSGSPLDAFRNGACRVDDRAVPVEDQKRIAMRHSTEAWRKRTISAGSGG